MMKGMEKFLNFWRESWQFTGEEMYDILHLEFREAYADFQEFQLETSGRHRVTPAEMAQIAGAVHLHTDIRIDMGTGRITTRADSMNHNVSVHDMMYRLRRLPRGRH